MANPATGSDLQSYKSLRRRIFYLAAAFVPVMVGVFSVSGWLFATFLPGHIIAVVWMVALAAMWTRLSYWRCPGCSGFIGWWPPLVAKCRRCGFPNIVPDGGKIN